MGQGGSSGSSGAMAGFSAGAGLTHKILKTALSGPYPTGLERVVFGTGCFWGSEKAFWKMPGVYTTAVGYAGGHTVDPTYEQTCSGSTGHTECVQVVYDPKRIAFADLVSMFLQCHDPTQVNGQGHDHGTQYRGAFYYTTPTQKQVGVAAIKKYEAQLGRKIATEVKPLDKFYFAEGYHQQHLVGGRQYCSAQPQGVILADAKEWMPAELLPGEAPKLSQKFWQKYAPSPHCVLRDPHTPFPVVAEDYVGGAVPSL